MDVNQGQRYSVVVSLGGGFLDVTVFSTSGNVYQAEATSGNTLLGGTNWHHEQWLCRMLK